MKHTTTLSLLALSTLISMPVWSMGVAVGGANNKNEYRAREVQLDQLKAASDKVEVRLSEMEKCGKTGGIYQSTTGKCLKYVMKKKSYSIPLPKPKKVGWVVKKGLAFKIIPLAPTTTKFSFSMLKAKDKLIVSKEEFLSASDVILHFEQKCFKGEDTGVGRMIPLHVGRKMDRRFTLTYLDKKILKDRAGYLRVQYNPALNAPADFTLTHSTLENACEIKAARVSFDVSKLTAVEAR